MKNKLKINTPISQQRGLLFLLLLIAILCLLLWTIDRAPTMTDVYSDDGVWDLRAHDFENSPVRLTGKSQIVQGELLNPEEFQNSSAIEYITVPSIDETLVYTARLRLLVPDDVVLAFMRHKSDGANNASIVYVNGAFLAQSGVPARTESDTIYDEWSPYFTVKGENGVIEIVTQVSNFVHRENRDQSAFYVGLTRQIEQMRAMSIDTSTILVGVYFVLFIVHMALFFLRPSYKPNLWFAILCVVWAARAGVVPPKELLTILPSLAWESAFRMEYLAIPTTLIIIIASYCKIFPGVIQKIPRIIIYAFGTICIMFCLVAPPITISENVIYMEILTAIAATYIVVRLFMKNRKPNTEQRVILMAFVIVLFALFFDTMHFNDFLGFGQYASLTNVALAIFFGFQMVAMFYATMNAELKAREAQERILLLTSQQEELLQAKMEAESANKAKSDFLATMSHEIRTPLNAIIGVSQILLNDDIEDRHRESVEKIRYSGNSLLAIINDILDLSKIESGKLEIQPSVIDTANLIYDTVMLNIVRIGNKPIEMQLEVDEQLPSELHGDELRMKQVMNNLLSNAFKYTEKGTVRLTITGQDADGICALLIAVSDTGQGMRQEDLDKLFTKYSRFNMANNRFTEGTGLGLNITKRLVNMMGGEITVKSVFGEGSEFSVLIPLRVIANAQPLGKEVKDRLEHFTFIKQTNDATNKVLIKPMPYGKVLVVDDIETNLFVARGLIERYRITVETAKSGQEAIDLIQSKKSYDIIFMDHMMPGLDGIETTKILRQSGYDKPIIALTANAIVGTQSLFLENGFDGYVSKPIDPRSLNEFLEKYVLECHKDEAVKQDKSIVNVTAKTKESAYNEQIIKAFIGDVKRNLPILDKTSREGDLKLFTITAHGIKSAAANCNLSEISTCAQALEMAGKNEDLTIIKEQTPILIRLLEEFLHQNTQVSVQAFAESDDADVSTLLSALKQSCEDYKEDEAVKLIRQIRTLGHTKETDELMDEVERHILHSEFEEAFEVL